jgi:hypothetical protein
VAHVQASATRFKRSSFHTPAASREKTASYAKRARSASGTSKAIDCRVTGEGFAVAQADEIHPKDQCFSRPHAPEGIICSVEPKGSEAEFWRGVEYSSRFFMGDADVQRALVKIVAELEAAKIPYAIAGAMALNWYGYRRVTTDVDLLLTREGLKELKERVLGRGYLEKSPGSKGMRDTEHNVGIDILITGDFPGDGKPKPVSFPDPATVASTGESARYLPLPKLIELKLASGLSAAHRVKDIADVVELIRAVKLPRELGAELDASVRAKYDELWLAVQAAGDEDY